MVLYTMEAGIRTLMGHAKVSVLSGGPYEAICPSKRHRQLFYRYKNKAYHLTKRCLMP